MKRPKISRRAETRRISAPGNPSQHTTTCRANRLKTLISRTET